VLFCKLTRVFFFSSNCAVKRVVQLQKETSDSSNLVNDVRVSYCVYS